MRFPEEPNHPAAVSVFPTNSPKRIVGAVDARHPRVHGERREESGASQPRAGASLLVGFAARLMPSSAPTRRPRAKTQEPHDVPFTRHQ